MERNEWDAISDCTASVQWLFRPVDRPKKCVGTLEICQITSDGRNVYLEALNCSMVAVSLLHSLWVYLVLNYYIKAHWHGGTQLVALVRN